MGTVPTNPLRVGHAFAPESRQVASTDAGTRATSALDPDALVERFARFLAGEAVDFDEIPLDLDGLTPFQAAVAGSLRGIERGEVVSYAELAALAGHPGAQRAVGTFCAHNRFAFLLPCHRVVGAGGIGGYGSAGVAVKRRLLRLEGVVL
jgi:methylated-DNA-[protein]-cysteine S-methyltransferase